MVSLLLHVVEQGEEEVNCTYGLGMAGLMAAHETAQLDVVELLLDQKDIDFTMDEDDTRGRSALGFVVSSKIVYFLLTTLDGLEEKLEFEELLEVRRKSLISYNEQEDMQDNEILSFLYLVLYLQKTFWQLFNPLIRPSQKGRPLQECKCICVSSSVCLWS